MEPVAAEAPERRRWPRAVVWTIRVLMVVAVALGLMALPIACTIHVKPPAEVRDPVQVFIIDQGRTSSLVLPTGTGQTVRYAFGDWNYYALSHDGLFDGMAALFLPTQGALGRRVMAAPPVEESVRTSIRASYEHIYPLTVDASRVAALRDELEAVYEQHLDTLIVSEYNDFEFVHHPQDYTWFYNSNHMVADWLRQLGAEVSRPTYYSTWQIEPAGGR